MAYQNKFDRTGRASREGAKAEHVFKVIVDEFFDSDIEATSFSDQLKHIDFHCDLPITVDVKSIKDPETIWIELKNVQGKDGWLLGEATHIAFERPKAFVLVRRDHLLGLVNKLVDADTIVSKASDCLYKLYSRTKWGRKDLLTKIRPSDLASIPYLLINK